MDILVLAESYRHFEHFIQNKSYIIKSFMKGDAIAEDKDGNKYYYFGSTDVAIYGRCFDKIIDIYSECTKRVSTGLLNKVVNEAYALNPPQTIRNKRLKILYATQATVQPPMFLFFANDENLLKDHYKRYLENKLREAFGFFGTPIRISVRTRTEKPRRVSKSK